MKNLPFTIAYLNRWQHADGLAVLTHADAAEPVLIRTDDESEEAISAKLTSVYGYQVNASRYDLGENFLVDADLFRRCPQLLAVSSSGAGYDTIDVDACTAAGVIAVNQAGGNREAVAEHTLSMMIVLSKRIIESDRAMRRERGWHRNDFIGHDIYGKTIGLIGLGHVGSRVAELCSGLFNMRVLAYDPYLTAEQITARKAEPAAFETLLQESDFVSLHCPRNAETLKMLGAEQFGLMKPEAFFITTARGGIHDEQALYQALVEKRIQGAGLDVWSAEPPPLEHPLLTLDNVIVSPHTAGVTHEARRQISIIAAEQWLAIIAGEQPARLLNPEVWPRYAARFREVTGRSVID